MIRAAIVLAMLCAMLSPSAAQVWRAGMRSEREARVAALEGCEQTGQSCSIYAVDDDLESDRQRGR